jgi:hypothetical protein
METTATSNVLHGMWSGWIVGTHHTWSQGRNVCVTVIMFLVDCNPKENRCCIVYAVLMRKWHTATLRTRQANVDERREDTSLMAWMNLIVSRGIIYHIFRVGGEFGWSIGDAAAVCTHMHHRVGIDVERGPKECVHCSANEMRDERTQKTFHELKQLKHICVHGHATLFWPLNMHGQMSFCDDGEWIDTLKKCKEEKEQTW